MFKGSPVCPTPTSPSVFTRRSLTYFPGSSNLLLLHTPGVSRPPCVSDWFPSFDWRWRGSCSARRSHVPVQITAVFPLSFEDPRVPLPLGLRSRSRPRCFLSAGHNLRLRPDPTLRPQPAGGPRGPRGRLSDTRDRTRFGARGRTPELRRETKFVCVILSSVLCSLTPRGGARPLATDRSLPGPDRGVYRNFVPGATPGDLRRAQGKTPRRDEPDPLCRFPWSTSG